MRLLLLVLLLVLPGCDFDDPEDPGGELGRVDFVRFYEPGRFQQWFTDLYFQSGVVAADQLSDRIVSYLPWLGPGFDLVPGTDDDVAPYPHLVGSRKLHPVTGVQDKRYWAAFAGGSWSTLNLEVSPEAKYRASSSYPSQEPKVYFRWCPATRPCMEWLTAVSRREVRCFRYGLNGQEVAVGRSTCALYHPRMFWQVIACDGCTIPTAAEVLEHGDE